MQSQSDATQSLSKPPSRALLSEPMSIRTMVGQMATSVARLDAPAVVEAAPAQPSSVRVFLYDAENADHQLRLDDLDIDKLEDHQLLWVDVSDPGATAEATSRLPLAPATVTRIMDGLTRP